MRMQRMGICEMLGHEWDISYPLQTSRTITEERTEGLQKAEVEP